MNYKDVYKTICGLAAEHLYSLEVYDQFDSDDEERVDRAIEEIQRQLRQKAETRTGSTIAMRDETEEELARFQMGKYSK